MNAEGKAPRTNLCLVIILSDHPALAVLNESPATGFRLAAKSFSALTPCEFSGFYDILRNPSGDLVGISYADYDALNFLGSLRAPFFERMERLEYVKVWRCSLIDILLTDRFQHDQTSNFGEQFFDETGFFRSQDGEFAISFILDDDVVAPVLLRPDILCGTEFVEIEPFTRQGSLANRSHP
jgi:hypothetical protein